MACQNQDAVSFVWFYVFCTIGRLFRIVAGSMRRCGVIPIPLSRFTG